MTPARLRALAALARAGDAPASTELAEAVRAALEASGGDRDTAARALSIGRRTLYDWRAIPAVAAVWEAAPTLTHAERAARGGAARQEKRQRPATR